MVANASNKVVLPGSDYREENNLYCLLFSCFAIVCHMISCFANNCLLVRIACSLQYVYLNTVFFYRLVNPSTPSHSLVKQEKTMTEQLAQEVQQMKQQLATLEQGTTLECKFVYSKRCTKDAKKHGHEFSTNSRQIEQAAD